MSTETITWVSTLDERPDADLVVLITTAEADEPVWLGFWDGSTWRDTDGMPVGVTHWAPMPMGAQS